MTGACDVLLHITTAAPWRVALAAGTLVTPSLVIPADGAHGFIHLSRPDQVCLPAESLYPGREDLLLLVFDPTRLDAEVRWEPGEPTEPESMPFPHLYGPLPVAAVTSVLPWRPGPGGGFREPLGLPAPGDLLARARAFDRSLAQRRAPVLLPVSGGMAVRDPRVLSSHEHNSVWFDGPVTASVLTAETGRALAGCVRWQAVLTQAPPVDLGWDVDEERVLVRSGDATELVADRDVEVVAVTGEVMAGLWGPAWRRDIPGITDRAVEELVRREAFADAHVRVIDLAVLGDAGVPVAGAQLRIDGATAAIEAVMTDPTYRGRGLAAALVCAAVDRARAAGCDCLWLCAAADDWPRHWYERLGFLDVGARWVVSTVPTALPG